jgi:hypothetical protein
MSDDLAAQIVGAAADGMRKYICDNGGDPDDDWTEEARAALVAALEALVQEADARDALSVSVSTLNALANRIEQGDGK